MFPVNPSTIFFLSLIAIVPVSGLAMRLGWRWRIPMLAIAFGIPVALLWANPPTGEYAGLGYVVVIVPSVVALVFGAVCGGVSRAAKLGTDRFAGVMVGGASLVAGFVLWQQYVPQSCIEAPLQVRIGVSVLHIPSAMRPRIEDGQSIDRFGGTEQKSSTASLCRRGRNGTRAIAADTVWITPAASHDEMTATCGGGTPPAWCSAYAPEPFRHIGKILIAPDTESGFPLPYWGKGSLKKDKEGDLTKGSVCLLSDDDIVTQCWIWRPFGDGFRLTVSTNNLDDIFADMPVEQARAMAATARDMTLAIIAE